MASSYESELMGVPPVDDLRARRNTTSPFGRFLAWALPRDPRPTFVWPLLAHGYVSRTKGRVVRLGIISAVLLAMTMGMITLLLNVPGLNYSVVTLITKAFSFILPEWLARALAWIVGLVAMFSIGDFTAHTAAQKRLESLSPTRSGFYNMWLRAALWEELTFRAGAEKWSWLDRFRVSVVFGCMHIVNIWYSMAAGIALSLTGFAFMMVYLWEYRRTKNQVAAVSVSATVHALYNTLAILVLFGFLGYLLLSFIMSWFGIKI